MSISNTATPKYYGQFRDKVLRGEIPVNQYISYEMNRIDQLIEDPRFYYDSSLVEGWIKFCENELCLTDGSPMTLLDSFKLWGEELFGWFYYIEKSVWVPGQNGKPGHFVNKRVRKCLTKKQFIISGRGSAKTMYMTDIQAYVENIDPSTTYQITVSPTMKQSEEVMSAYRTSIVRSRGPLFKFLTDGSLQNTTGSNMKRVKLASTKKGIQNFLTNSLLEVRPMSIDKLQGLRCKVATVDEWLSCDIREDPIDAIEQGCSKGGQDYYIVCASSEGTIRNGVGDTIKMELLKILKGEMYSPQVSIWWYCLDDPKEVNDPNMWLKANPNIGATVDWEVYQDDVYKAEHIPSSANDILAKRFGIPMSGFTYFFTYEETLPHPKKDFWQMPCSLGADLSQGNDFCAFTFMFPLGNDRFGIHARSYITSLTLSELPLAMRGKYDEFIEEGSLIIMNGATLRMDEVYEDLDKYISFQNFDVRSFGYDPYNAKEFVQWWERDNGPFGIEKVIQGKKTESVPLGELKTLAHERYLEFDQKIMQFTMGNCIVEKDNNNNMMILKKKYEQKIDNVSAMMDAYVAYKANLEAFE